MTEQIVPILRVADAEAAVGWYARLGFAREFEHRFAPGMPRYVGLRRGEVQMSRAANA